MTMPQTANVKPRSLRLQIIRVQTQPRWLSFLSPVILVILALIVGAGLLSLTGANPWFVYRRMGELAFGSLYGWSDTTIKATPLILAGLGVSVAFRMRLWNIGAEGQLFIGAFAATGVALFPASVEHAPGAMLAAMAIAGFIGGDLGLHPRRAQGKTQRQRDHHQPDADLCRRTVEQLLSTAPGRAASA